MTPDAPLREALERIANRLIDQQDEPWPAGTESDRLHYWRGKAIVAANELASLRASSSVAGEWPLVCVLAEAIHDRCYGVSTHCDPQLALTEISDNGGIHEAVHQLLRALPPLPSPPHGAGIEGGVAPHGGAK